MCTASVVLDYRLCSVVALLSLLLAACLLDWSPGQFDAATRVRRKNWAKKMLALKGGVKKACQTVDIVLDNFDVSLPIPSKVPRGYRER